MGILTKDDILKAEDLPTKEVEVPEWGGTVIVRTLTGKERDEFEESLWAGEPGTDSRKRNWENMRARLVALTVVGEDGKRLFQFSEAMLLGNKSSRALDRLFDIARELSGIMETGDEKKVRENLSSGQSDNSTSG